MSNLASELGVTDRTIRSDIMTLTVDYPLETVRGNGGGVRLASEYHPHRHIFTLEEQEVLRQMLLLADDHQSVVLQRMLCAYGSPGQSSRNKFEPQKKG